MFASGNGSNFEALAAASSAGRLGGTLTALLCDQPQAFVIERARSHGIEALTPPTGRFRSRLEDEGPWLGALAERGIDLVVLAGFMRRLHAPLLSAYAGRMLNIHPSLLPSFPGLDAIGQAWRHGVRITGCTVHLVDDALDAGPIVAQSSLEVGESETLESLTNRIHTLEHQLFPPAIERFLTRSWRLDGRRLSFDAMDATRG